MACDDDTSMIPCTPSRHVSMEGGLDDSSLLTMGSPKVPTPVVMDPSDDKENVDTLDFAKPRVPSRSPRKSKLPAESIKLIGVSFKYLAMMIASSVV